MALDYITVRGFKSIASIEKLPLRPINVLIGSNGSGKSNFIGVFAFLHAIREGRLRDYVTHAGGAEKILHFGSRTTESIYIYLSFHDEINQYGLSLSPTQDDGLYPSYETAGFWEKSRGLDKPTTEVLDSLGSRTRSWDQQSEYDNNCGRRAAASRELEALPLARHELVLADEEERENQR